MKKQKKLSPEAQWGAARAKQVMTYTDTIIGINELIATVRKEAESMRETRQMIVDNREKDTVAADQLIYLFDMKLREIAEQETKLQRISQVMSSFGADSADPVAEIDDLMKAVRLHTENLKNLTEMGMHIRPGMPLSIN